MECILITGGTGLIGSEYVKHFLKKGFKVVTTYRNYEKFNQTLDTLNNNLVGIEVDLLATDASNTILNKLKELNIQPDYLVNNASNLESHKINDNGFTDREYLLKMYEINVILPYELSFKLANQNNTRLKKIINISSMYGIVPYNPCLYEDPLTETAIQYSVAKAAIIHLTKELAIRFADKNIMVNSISYGGVEGRADDNFKKKFAKVTPLKRMLKPDEAVKSLDFLIGDDSVYMTGHNLVVDGGRTIW